MKRVALLAVLAVLPGTLDSGIASAKKVPVRPTLEVRDLKQDQILRKNRISVRLRNERGTVVRIDLTARRPEWRKGRSVKLTKSKTVSLKTNSQVVRLKMTSRGRGLVRICRASKVTAVAQVVKRGRKVGLPGRDSRPLTLSRQRCADTPEPPVIDLTDADRCEFLAGPECLLPWPNNYFTEPDASSPTGIRVNLDRASTPANSQGIHVDPVDLNRSDGFSPGSMIVAKIPGFDTPEAFEMTGSVRITDMARYADPDQPIVLIDAATGERQLIWSELDLTATSPDGRALIIRPGRNLIEGHRYIVALRNLRNSSGEILPPSDAFRVYRDRLITRQTVVEDRRPAMEDIFGKLTKAGLARDELYLAWDFTVASTENLTSRVLSMRDDAFRELGDDDLDDGVVQGEAPEFEIITGPQGGEDYPPGSTGVGENYSRKISGWMRVPCYLDKPGCAGNARFDLGPDGLPRRIPGNETMAYFTCGIPRTGLSVGGPDGYTVEEKAQPVLHGHGLFGSANQVHTSWTRKTADENGQFTCGTNWTGLDGSGQAPFVERIQEMSRFPEMTDRLQQSWINALYLGRLMIHPDGLAADSNFQYDGVPVFRTQDLGYWGVSNGGIMGGALTAIAPDFTRSVLAVPAMNFSTMFTRNNLWASELSPIFATAYPREIDHPLLMSMMQLWWDRGEPNGYANHITRDPLPDTPLHKVLIEMAYGDHEVANVATEVMARTLELPVRRPLLDPGRSPDTLPGFGLPSLGTLPGPGSTGNGMFVWDTGPKRIRPSGTTTLGTLPPPTTNTAPSADFGPDPHTEILESSAALRAQIGAFLRPGGTVIDPCGPAPCYAGEWSGP